MNPVSILLGTFIIWIAGRGKLGTYWAFASTSSAALPVPAASTASPSLPVAPGGGGAVLDKATNDSFKELQDMSKKLFGPSAGSQF